MSNWAPLQRIRTFFQSSETVAYTPIVDSAGSPYPEVQASIPPIDEDVPVNTFRAWALGIVGTMVLTALNQFFQLHSPPSK